VAVGASVRLADVDDMARAFGVSRKVALSFLHRMDVPLVLTGQRYYVDWYALELLFRALLRPGVGAKHIRFPGSNTRCRRACIRSIEEVDPETRAVLKDPYSPLHLWVATAGLAYMSADRERMRETLLKAADMLRSGGRKRKLRQ
jgi:hypothetical protein